MSLPGSFDANRNPNLLTTIMSLLRSKEKSSEGTRLFFNAYLLVFSCAFLNANRHKFSQISCYKCNTINQLLSVIICGYLRLFAFCLLFGHPHIYFLITGLQPNFIQCLAKANILFYLSDRPINGTAIDTKNTTLFSFHYLNTVNY